MAIGAKNRYNEWRSIEHPENAEGQAASLHAGLDAKQSANADY
jgi:hypothetical protein